MIGKRNNASPTSPLTGRKAIGWAATALGLTLILTGPVGVTAQQASSFVYTAGNVAVTGFSGALPPVQIAPGEDPDPKTFIDLNGPSLRVVDLHHMGGLPQAQLVGAPKPFTFTAALLGQVFGVALDANSPPNIYAAATSAYGIPIVALGPDGQPQHIRIGAPPATFMPGLWGPHGGPGSIWKIDGQTGAVTLFAIVTTGGRANSGAALGGLAFDPDSKSLFVVDRESGLIHRTRGPGPAAGALECADRHRRYQSSIRQHAARDLELCGAGAPHFRARRARRPAVLRGGGQFADLVGRAEP
jgi:hypothetical protein